MSKITESLRRLSVENDEESQSQENKKVPGKGELTLLMEETVSRNNYILSVCGTQSESEFRIGAALSNRTCVIYSVGESLNRTDTLNHNKAPIVGIKFSPTSRNILYTASNDGQITVCDLRAKGKVVAEFKDNTEGQAKPLACFDISCDERLLAGGTEHISGDTFILFWDIRYSNSKMEKKNSLLGGYWESHLEEITCLTFHPAKRNILASGSTDGLINVFDLVQTSEDLALTYSLNTESSVDRLGWLTDDSLWCTTYTELQLWDRDGASAYATFKRNNLHQNESPDNCYFVRVHATNAFGQPYLLAGSNSPTGTPKKQYLGYFSIVNNSLERHDIEGNKQIVRDSWLHEKSGSLVTVGEQGIINVWQRAESTHEEP